MGFEIVNSKYGDEINHIRSIRATLQSPEIDPDAAIEVTAEVTRRVERKANFWTALVDFFSNLLGRVSEYRALREEAAALEQDLSTALEKVASKSQIDISPNKMDNTYEKMELDLKFEDIKEDSWEDAAAEGQLEVQEEVASETEKVVQDVVDQINPMIQQLDLLNDYLLGIQRHVTKRDLTSQELIRFDEERARIASLFGAIKDAVKGMAEIYAENSTDSTLLDGLLNRYAAARTTLKEITEVLSLHWIASMETIEAPDLSMADPMIVDALGGIINGGNTCYLASAVQTINATPPYKRMFDRKQHPLQRRHRESRDNFRKRRRIQRLGHELLEKIQSGQTVASAEINAFRKACYRYASNDQRIINSLSDMADAGQTLERILDAMDYQPGSFEVKKQMVDFSEDSVVLPEADPNEYSTLENISSKTESNSPTIEVSAFPYLNGTVAMQQLIDEHWADEWIEGVKVQKEDDQGNRIVKQYASATLTKTAVVGEPPEVIRITVKQLEGAKAVLTDAKTIYPFGIGNGPAYTLTAVIKHWDEPMHYTSSSYTESGQFVEANDRLVYPVDEAQPGFVYYYVRE